MISTYLNFIIHLILNVSGIWTNISKVKLRCVSLPEQQFFKRLMSFKRDPFKKNKEFLMFHSSEYESSESWEYSYKLKRKKDQNEFFIRLENL